MKHPALTRVMAIALALLCLTMAAAGGLGLRGAQEDLDRADYEITRLRERAASYREITDSLADRESYAERSAALEEKQSDHAGDSAEHRTEVSTYSLTQYGLAAGTAALDAADQQFASYKAMFEQAIPTFEQGLSQAEQLVGGLRQIYDTAYAGLAAANSTLAYANVLAWSLSAGEALTYADITAACDQALVLADELAAVPEQIQSLIPALEAISDFDPTSLTALADTMSQLPASLGSFGEVDLSAYTEAGSPVDFDLEQIVQLKAVYDSLWNIIKPALEEQDDLSDTIEAQFEAVTGMSLTEARQALQVFRNAMAEHGYEPLDPELSAAVQEEFNRNSASLLAELDRVNSAMNEISFQAAELGYTLGEIESAVAGFSGLLAQADTLMSEGENALYWARAAIWQQMGQQREKEQELREQRDELGREAEQLQELTEAAEAQKKAEQRQRALRAILLRRDEIRSRVEAGEEPDAAALAYAGERESRAQTEHRQRVLACRLMLAGGLCALLAIPAAFEQIRSRFLLLAPVLVSLGCALGAERIFLRLGRGHSYSALAVVIFSLFQLFISLPRTKKPN